MNKTREETVQAMLDNLCTNTDFDLLYAQKLTLQESVTSGTPIPKIALEGLVNFLDLVGDLGEALGRFQYEGIEPPFPMQPDYKQKVVVFEPEPEPKMHLLCEEYEDDGAIRQFRILAVSRDEDELRKLMRAKIQKDEYGYIGTKGVRDDDENHFCTNFEEGFVEYYILEEEVLSKAQIQQLLSTREYDSSFRYPQGFRDLLVEQLRRVAANEGYGEGLNLDKASQYFMEHKGFQGALKGAWWFGADLNISPERVNSFCSSFVREALDEEPDLFEKIGSIPAYHSPDNLREAVLDNVYDAAKTLRIPSLNAEETADKLLRSIPFRAWVSETFGDLDHLDLASDRYHSDFAEKCRGFLTEMLRNEAQKNRHPGLDDVISSATQRAAQQKGAEGPAKEQDR